MKVLLDNNLSPQIARAINHLIAPDGHQLISKKDKFGDPRIDDIDWIAELDEEGGWAFISLDTHIRRRPHEREVLRRSEVTAFFLAPAWQRFPPIRQAAQIMQWWSRLEREFNRSKPGTSFFVPWKSSSKLHRLKP